jgi:hypothetical protein
MPPVTPFDIPTPSVAADRGVRANLPAVNTGQVANDQIGRAMSGFAQDMNAVAQVGRNLFDVRQKAEDQAFVDHTNLELSSQFNNIMLDALKSPNSGRPDFPQTLDRQLAEAHKTYTDKATSDGGFFPSAAARQQVDHLAMGLRLTVRQQAIVASHNERSARYVSLTDADDSKIMEMAVAASDSVAAFPDFWAKIEANNAGRVQPFVTGSEYTKRMDDKRKELAIRILQKLPAAERQRVLAGGTGFSDAVKDNFVAANENLKLTPEERFIYREVHLTNLYGKGGFTNKDGGRSTVLATTAEFDGKTYIIPTVYDGKQVSNEEAVKRAKEVGIDKFPGYATRKEAEARYGQIHQYMDADAAAVARQKSANATGLENSLIYRESGSNPTKVNQLGYAGYYQFGAPRLADLGIYKPGADENVDKWSKTPATAPGKWSGTFSIPGYPEVKTLSDFLNNPAAQKVAWAAHADRMDQEIDKNGFDKYIGQNVGGVTITREGLQGMLHIGGVGGTKATLEGKQWPADANGTTVLSYAKLGAHSEISDLIKQLPFDVRQTMAIKADKDRKAELVEASQNAYNTIERQLIEAKAGNVPLIDRGNIERNLYLSEKQRNAALKEYDTASKDIVSFKDFEQRAQTGGIFNKYDKKETANADLLYKKVGGTPAAAQAVVAATSIVPPSKMTQLRSDIMSGDMKRVGDALAEAVKLHYSEKASKNNNNLFDHGEGGKDIQNAMLDYNLWRNTAGRSHEESLLKVIQNQDPQRREARLKDRESVLFRKKIDEGVTASDLPKAFADGIFAKVAPSFFGATAGDNLRIKQNMLSDYKKIVEEHYLDTGDLGNAKARAAVELRRTYGVTKINGTGEETIMKWAPNKSKVYAGVPDDQFDKMFVKQIEEVAKDALWSGPDGKVHYGVNNKDDAAERKLQLDMAATPDYKSLNLSMKDVRIQAIPGITPEFFRADAPPVYDVFVKDANGVEHQVNRNRPFYADPNKMKADLSAQRDKESLALETSLAQKNKPVGFSEDPARAAGQRLGGYLGTGDIGPYVLNKAADAVDAVHNFGKGLGKPVSEAERIDRWERGLQHSGLGGAFREAQMKKIKAAREALAKSLETP